MDLHQARPGPRRPRPARAPGHPHLRHRLRLREPARHRPLLPHTCAAARRSRRRWARPSSTTWSASTSPRARSETGPAGQEPAGGGLPARRADLHVVARRQLDRHEPGRAAAGRLASSRIDPLARRQPDGRHRLRRQAKRRQVGVLILGGGSPKNFMLQTEPQIQEVLGLDESGPRLLPAGHRRPPRHRRPRRGHAGARR